MFKRFLTYSILTLIALGGFFGNISISSNSNQGSLSTISLGSNITYAEPNGYRTPEEANATNANNKETSSTASNKQPSSSASVDMYNKIIGGLNIALAVLSAMISPIVLFVGWLMSPDWTSGDLFGLRAPMYALWVTVSNIVYFIYAILLILIALGTMFGQDKFSYKVMLPKLALGILMVPFTWWFVQWTISIASVVTASVMTIPTETIGENDSAWFKKPSIPGIIIIDNTGTGTDTGKVDCEEGGGAGCISPKDFLKKSGGMYGPLIVYGYSIFKFKEIQELKTGLDVAKAALQIVHTSIVSTIMFAVFGILVLALASMLLVRAMKLWMYAIFAPLFTFRFVAGSNLLGGDDDSFSIKEFVGLAFVPAIVGLTLSFGLIIINAVQGPANPSTPIGTQCDLIKGCEILNIMGSADNKITRKIEKPNTPDAYTNTKFEYGGIQFYFFGKATNQTNTTSTAIGAIDAVGGMFGTLIVDVIALVFIWMAFMAAKNVSKAVKMAVQPFEDIGNKIGGLAKSMPKYMPIPGLGVSASGIGKVIEKKEQGMVSDRQNRDANSALGKWAGLEGAQRAGTRNALNDYTSNQITQASTKNVLVQISQESEGNQIKGATEMLNSAIKRFTKTDDKGKVEITDPTKFKEAIKWMNLDEINDYGKIKDHIEKNNGNISENFLRENANGKDMLKKMVGNKTPPNNEKPSTGAKDENKPGGEKPPATPSSTPSPKH